MVPPEAVPEPLAGSVPRKAPHPGGALLAGGALGALDGLVAALPPAGLSGPSRLRLGLCDGALVGAFAFAGAWALLALLAALGGLSRPWRRGVGAVLGVALGALFAGAAFTGGAVLRSGLAPWLKGASVVLGGALGGALAGKLEGTRTRDATAFSRLFFGLLSMVAYGVHARVLPRLYPGLHGFLAAAALVAACGATAQRGAPRRRRWLAPSIALLALVGTVGIRGSRALRARAAQAPLGRYPSWVLARLLPAPPAAAVAERAGAAGPHLPLAGRDLVLVTVDALRADRLRALGGLGRVPTLDALAARGALYTRAYCATPHTSYSVASVLLGTWARAALALPNADTDRDTLATWLRREGYHTAAFYPPAVFAVDGERFGPLRARGFGFDHHEERYSDARARVQEVARWLGARREGERLFLWVHLFEPHEPYEAHPEHPFGPSDRDRYDAEAAAADDAIAALQSMFSRAHRTPVWVVTADHGEEFGEHGGSFHGTTVYDEQVRVPLVFAGPGVPSSRVATPVSLVDLAATLLAGVGAPRPPRVRGTDLGPLAFGPSAAPRVFASTGTLRMVLEGSLKLIVDEQTGATELYDLTGDPRERHNLADDDPSTVERLRGALATWEAGHARAEAQGRPRETTPELPDALNRAIQGDLSTAPEVARLVASPERLVARRAARVLGDLGARDPAVTPALARGTDGTDPLLATECALSLALLGDARGRDGALQALTEGRDRTRAALGLGALRDPAAEPVLAELATSTAMPEGVRDRAVAALRALRDPRSLGAWEALLGDPRLAPEAARALGDLGIPSAAEALRRTLATTRYPLTRRACAGALVALRAPGAEALALASLVGEAPLPDAFGLLTALQEPGRAVCGTRQPRAITPRGVRLSLRGPRSVVTRVYLWVEASQPTTLTVGPWGSALEVPSGRRELALDVSRGRRPGAVYLRAVSPVRVLGVALR